MDDNAGKIQDTLVNERLEQYDHKKKETVVKCLQSCVSWFPPGGRASLIRDILKADSDEFLYDVYDTLMTGLLIPMKETCRQASVFASPHSKREANVDLVASTIAEPQYRSTTFRDTLLKRDDYRCVVSGHVDPDYYEQMGLPEDVLNSDLEGAHIIPFSYASWRGEGVPDDAPKVWEVLFRCFPEVRGSTLEVDTINSPENGLTLTVNLHRAFGRFKIAFKATGIKDQYEIKSYKRLNSVELSMIPKNRLVTFRQAEGHKDIPLPNPILLDCHYRIAEILDASGLREVIERSLDYWDQIRRDPQAGQLREDGSTHLTNYLEAAFWWDVGT
ncbi:HNH endonuclease signature motif containing protein [Aspergillus ibericus CBS 121593]|uniref:HNH nuclease domain-containing protein n=1 Tax=Aspergillus ibericus CBS 121593 TaxID=1448316 RepID=A0A395GWQ2_9EURO|nr:hypothetical protein BO80DRAFT_357967 [Aspergillus ibericus CBS 121593]RAK99966.1 hypothetical protein BO80DRAFT_357967 [Aspergillus ibericus CBS 121593]